MTLENILLVTTGTLTALLAGVFFGYSISVNGALHKLKDVEYIRAMQAINIVIQNPLFFLTFMGPVVLLPIATFMLKGDSSTQFALLLAASVIYIFGSFILTVAGNVPMNEKLAKFDVSGATAGDITAAREQFEKPWNRLHNIRTLASVVATVLIFVACIS